MGVGLPVIVVDVEPVMDVVDVSLEVVHIDAIADDDASIEADTLADPDVDIVHASVCVVVTV